MKYEDHLVLHGLAIKKYAASEDVAAAVDLDPRDVREVLTANVQYGRVTEVEGRYSLLPAGRLIVKGEYSRHYGNLRNNTTFVDAYDAFEEVNEDLKALITRWQVHEVAGARVPNDHSDQAYDDKIIDRLGALHERFEPILEAMIGELPRLAIYPLQFDHALERAELGEIEWVSEVKIASYHTLWFELHEDLLCILGRTRVELRQL